MNMLRSERGGLLALPMDKSGPQFLQNEIHVKDGIVKNPKKRKKYKENPEA